MIPKIKELEKKGSFKFYFKSKDGKIKKELKIKFVENPKKFSGGYGGSRGIEVDKLFYKFKEKEKEALLWHELYHSKFSTWFWKKIWEEIKNPFNSQKRKCDEEFEADKYSSLKNSKRDCLDYLNKIKGLYEKNLTLYNSKTHPPIKERIEKIDKLKN